MRRLAVALVLSLVAACGSGDGSASPDGEVRERLLSLADRAAEQNGGRVARVEVVESTRAAANQAIGAGVSGDEAVWVMQIEGEPGDPFLGIRSGKPGRYIFSVLRQSDYVNTDGGMSQQPTDLSQLGEVTVLRE